MQPLARRSALSRFNPTVAALGAIALLTSLTAASCDKALDVTLARVGRATVNEVVDAPASVTARGAATLTAPADGSLATLAVAAGAQVRRGQVLAVIDSPSAQARLRQAKQALDAAKQGGGGGTSINLSGAQRHLDRAASEAFDQARAAATNVADPQARAALLAQITASEQRYATAARGVAAAANAVQRGVASLGSAMRALSSAQRLQAQQAYDLAKATVTALTLRAPLAGVVQFGGTSSAPSGSGDLSSLLGGLTGGTGGLGAPATGSATPAGVATAVSVGAPVTAGTAILTVVDVADLGLVAEVDETDILLVTNGITADAELDAAPGVAYPATVRSVDVLPTANSRGAVAYRVHLGLGTTTGRDGTPAPTPRPGMSAVVRLRVRHAADVIAVPAAAVFSVEGHDAVWVRRGDGTAERRTVRIGVSGMDMLQVVSGLQEGEQIVIRGVDLVKAGDRLP